MTTAGGAPGTARDGYRAADAADEEFDEPRPAGVALCACWHGSLSGYCHEHDMPRIQIDPGHPDAWGCNCPRLAAPLAGQHTTDEETDRG